MSQQAFVPKDISKRVDKIISPRQVPKFLDVRKESQWEKIERDNAFRRLPFIIPDNKKVEVLKVVNEEHGEEFKQYCHPKIKLIGGIMGEKPNSRIGAELGLLQEFAWSEKDGGTMDYRDYTGLVEKRWKTLAPPSKTEKLFVRNWEELNPTPMPVYYLVEGDVKGPVFGRIKKLDVDGKKTDFEVKTDVEGSVFPRQTKTRLVTTWESTVRMDIITGNVMICPKICSYMTKGGVGKALITQGVLPYATLLAYLRYVDDLLAYSRPSDYGPDKRIKSILEHLQEDANYKFHIISNKADLVCVVKGGINKNDPNTATYGFITGYTKYFRPNKDFQEFLDRVGETVKKFLSK